MSGWKLLLLRLRKPLASKMGTVAVNRLGKKFTSIDSPIDQTPNFIAGIFIRRPPIEKCELLPDGSIQFRLLLKNTGMTMNWREAKMMRTRWFANCLGEFLVRSNFYRFDEIVLSPAYPKQDRSKTGFQFGYRITTEFIEFKVHSAILFSVFNEGLRRELRELVG